MAAKQEFIIKEASSKLRIDKLLEGLAAVNKMPPDVAQVFNPDLIISRAHILGAYENAKTAFREKRNVSSSAAVEMMLYAAMTRQIGAAIKMMGAKSNKNFVIFANSKAALSRLKDTVSIRGDFRPSAAKSLQVARKFGITQKDDLDDFVLQKMALALLD